MLRPYDCAFLDDLDLCRKRSEETIIWNIKKQVYFPGPILDEKLGDEVTLIALNRSHVLALYMVKDDSMCLKGLIYSFKKFEWTQLNSDHCFFETDHWFSSDEMWRVQIVIKGVQHFDKSDQ